MLAIYVRGYLTLEVGGSAVHVWISECVCACVCVWGEKDEEEKMWEKGVSTWLGGLLSTSTGWQPGVRKCLD